MHVVCTPSARRGFSRIPIAQAAKKSSLSGYLLTKELVCVSPTDSSQAAAPPRHSSTAAPQQYRSSTAAAAPQHLVALACLHTYSIACLLLTTHHSHPSPLTTHHSPLTQLTTHYWPTDLQLTTHYWPTDAQAVSITQYATHVPAWTGPTHSLFELLEEFKSGRCAAAPTGPAGAAGLQSCRAAELQGRRAAEAAELQGRRTCTGKYVAYLQRACVLARLQALHVRAAST